MHGKQNDQNHDRDRNDVRVDGWGRDFQTLNRGQHRQCRSRQGEARCSAPSPSVVRRHRHSQRHRGCRNPEVLLAFSPVYGMRFLTTHGVIGSSPWARFSSSVTGAEALFVDLGHFGRKPMPTAWSGSSSRRLR